MPVGLSMDDVNKLALDPSVATRTNTAVLLAQQFSTQVFKPVEIQIAHEIFRIMVRDAEVRVREALAANLKNNPKIPHDVAIALAEDVDSVSLPVLAYSEVLTSDDLVKIINAQNSFAKMETIAGRAAVDESVSAALVERGSEKVVAKLLRNPGAAVSESTLHRTVDRFSQSEIVLEPLVHRSALPVTISERLIVHVTDHLRTHLLAKHKVSADVAIELVLQTRERATAGLASGIGDEGLGALVRQLKDNGRLTASLLLRAACMGNLRFLEQGLALLAAVPVTNARVLIHEASGAGLRALWAKAGLNPTVLPAIRAAVEAADRTEFTSPDRYARRVLERVLTQHDALADAIDHDDLEFLLGRVTRFSRDSALH